MVIISIIPFGYTKSIREKTESKNILFGPEFLRESKALYDNDWAKQEQIVYECGIIGTQVIAVGYTKNKLITNVMMWFDKFSCRQSNLIITVGHDLVETVRKRFQGEKVPKTVMINNWIDENEICPLAETHPKVLAFRKKYALDGKFVIMYSGNIGLFYDLENLIRVIKRFRPNTQTKDGREVVFAFVGAGSVLDALKNYVKKNDMLNVVFIPY